MAAACGGGGGGTSPPPTCSVTGQAPSALFITLSAPTRGIGAGGTLTAAYQFSVVNYTSADLNATVHVPTSYAKFPLANSTGYFVLTFAPHDLLVAGPSWSAPVIRVANVTSPLNFSTAGKAYLSTANLAVMVLGGSGNVTLEFRWGWTANRSGPTTSWWSTPNSAPAAPNYPSIFGAAPYVRVNATSNTTASSGSMFTLALWGAVGKTSFRTAIETPTGKELQCQVEKNPWPGACFVYSVPLTYQNGTELPLGHYLVHVHDSMGAIVASLSIVVTNATWHWSGWGGWGAGHSGGVTCNASATGGCGGGGGSSGWGFSGTGGGRGHHHGHW